MGSEWDWGGGVTLHPRDSPPLLKMWAVVLGCMGLKGQEVKDQWRRRSHVCNVPLPHCPGPRGP